MRILAGDLAPGRADGLVRNVAPEVVEIVDATDHAVLACKKSGAPGAP